MATHPGQRRLAKVYAKVLAYLDVIRPHLLEAYVDLDNVINMDQTPVYHAMNVKYTLIGSRQVVRQCCCDDHCIWQEGEVDDCLQRYVDCCII